MNKLPFEEMREKVYQAGPSGFAAALSNGGWALDEYVAELNRVSEIIRKEELEKPRQPTFRTYENFGLSYLPKLKSTTFEQMIKVDDIK